MSPKPATVKPQTDATPAKDDWHGSAEYRRFQCGLLGASVLLTTLVVLAVAWLPATT